MKLWIDNTGLQSAGLCLNGQARGDDDVDGLLQLATFLAFSDGMVVNNFEHPTVRDKTFETVEYLRLLGVDEPILDLSNENSDSYALACRTAATDAAESLSLPFRLVERQLPSLKPVCMPSGMEGGMARVYDLALKEKPESVYDEVRAVVLEEKAAGAVRYMLATSADLRNAIRNWAHSLSTRTASQFDQLDAYLRYHLNSVLAEQNYSTYGPAVARAALMRKQRSDVLGQLSDGVNAVVAELSGKVVKPLGVPAVAAALIQRAKGDPKRVVEEAVELRTRTGILRKWLGRVVSRCDLTTPNGAFEAHREMSDMIKLLREHLGLASAPRRREAFELVLVLGVFPAPQVNVVKLLECIKYCIRRRKIAVLSELSKGAAFGDQHRWLTTLRRKSCGQSNSRV